MCTFASAYNARPKLVVVIVIDQFRGDYLERYRDQFSEGGFRLFLDRGAYFTDCNYDYANTRTAPGHATLFTGTYTSGHGIIANEWWDPQKKKRVTSVEDDATKLVGSRSPGIGASPINLTSDTLGRRVETGYRRQGPSVRHFPERSRSRPSRRILGRRRLLDRSQERRLDHLDLLPPRPACVGSQFQRKPSRGEILEPRVER